MAADKKKGIKIVAQNKRARHDYFVLENWEAIKRKQRGITSVAEAMDDVSTGLSPLLRARCFHMPEMSILSKNCPRMALKL